MSKTRSWNHYNDSLTLKIEIVYNNFKHKPRLGLPPSLEEPYEAEAPRTVLKPSLSSNGA
jgi:hypothetical protein